jgi:hypothetical protein
MTVQCPVQATAAWYFRQFYTNNSMLDHDPRLIMYDAILLASVAGLPYRCLHFVRLCCMFLAGKTEDSFVNIADLLKIYNKATEPRVLECEILLLEVGNTTMKVWLMVVFDCKFLLNRAWNSI